MTNHVFSFRAKDKFGINNFDVENYLIDKQNSGSIRDYKSHKELVITNIIKTKYVIETKELIPKVIIYELKAKFGDNNRD